MYDIEWEGSMGEFDCGYSFDRGSGAEIEAARERGSSHGHLDYYAPSYNPTADLLEEARANGFPSNWIPRYAECMDGWKINGGWFVLNSFSFMFTREHPDPEVWFTPDGTAFCRNIRGIAIDKMKDPAHDTMFGFFSHMRSSLSMEALDILLEHSDREKLAKFGNDGGWSSVKVLMDGSGHVIDVQPFAAPVHDPNSVIALSKREAPVKRPDYEDGWFVLGPASCRHLPEGRVPSASRAVRGIKVVNGEKVLSPAHTALLSDECFSAISADVPNAFDSYGRYIYEWSKLMVHQDNGGRIVEIRPFDGGVGQ